MDKNGLKKGLIFDIADEIELDETTKKYLDYQEIEGKYININKTTIKRDTNPYQKKKGVYYSLEFKNLEVENEYKEVKNNIISIILAMKNKMVPKEECNILIVGLGNDEFTPDSLGPNVVRKINPTFHLGKEFNIKNKICSLIPGVKGITGLESGTIIKNIVNNYKIDLVICIDSLATSSLNRLNKVIQITDTSIIPGSGVSNYRQEISKRYLGVPVIIIGVGTVINIESIYYEIISNFDDIDADSFHNFQKNMVKGLTFSLKEIEKKMTLLSKVISSGINEAFNPTLISFFDK